MKVYIAGSSAEIQRVLRARTWLDCAGLTVVSTWTDVIAGQPGQVGNPRDATVTDRMTWSLTDLAQIDAADLVWFLVPPAEIPTRGAWVEVGYAKAKKKAIVFSGDTKQSIFCAMSIECEDDVEALAKISRIARER